MTLMDELEQARLSFEFLHRPRPGGVAFHFKNQMSNETENIN
jgi:hypothetical protein